MRETTVVGADALFQQYTVKEIQDIEKKLRNDIEKKKEDVRQMVGERYRDLIDAADTIIDMKTSAESVTKHIKLIEGHCSRLQAATRPSGILPSSTCRDEQRHNNKVKLFAIAAEIKVLMDMPAMLWSAVECNNFLSAAQLFLLAQYIHSSLLLDSAQNFHDVPLLTKFPVIRHQSTLIGQFRSFISQQCRTSLKHDHLATKELTNIFCCILLLDDSSPMQLFKEFLDVRSEVVNDILRLNKEGTTAKSQVCEVVQLIVNTIQLVSSVFGRTNEKQGKGDCGQSLFEILNVILDKNCEGPASYLSDKISLSYAYLPSHIKDYRPTLRSKLEPVSQNDLRDVTKQWIKKVKDVVHVNLGSILQYIPSIKGLVLINEAVEKKLAELDVGQWQQDCLSITNENLSIYDVFLKVALIERVKIICNKHLENAFKNCQENITKCLERIIRKHPEVEDEDVTRYVWTEYQNDIALNIQAVLTSNSSLVSGGGMLEMKANRHTPQIQSLCKDFDENLRILLDDVRCFGSGDCGTRSYELEMQQLHQHLVESTHSMFIGFSQFIQDILSNEAYKTEMYIQIWPPYLGRLCHAFVELCNHARLCLIYEEIQSKDINPVVKKDRAWQEVKTKLLRLSDDAFNCWCSYLDRCFKIKLSGSLGACAPADFLQNVLQWEEVEIQEEMEDGKSIKSMIQVPIQASSYLQSALFTMCQDFNHSTGHIMNKAVMKEFNKRLVLSSLECYGEASVKLQARGSTINPRLVQMIALQLLFDVQLLVELLCPKDDPQLQERADSVTSALESLIDPFDLDVFNPSLQSNLNCALQRSVLLFGLIISERSTSVSSQRLGSQNQPPNLLPLSASAGRFLLLPVASNKSDALMSTSMKEENSKSAKGIMSRSFGSSPNLGQTGSEGVTKSYSFYDRVTAMGSSWFGTGN